MGQVRRELGLLPCPTFVALSGMVMMVLPVSWRQKLHTSHLYDSEKGSEKGGTFFVPWSIAQFSVYLACRLCPPSLLHLKRKTAEYNLLVKHYWHWWSHIQTSMSQERAKYPWAIYSRSRHQTSHVYLKLQGPPLSQDRLSKRYLCMPVKKTKTKTKKHHIGISTVSCCHGM